MRKLQYYTNFGVYISLLGLKKSGKRGKLQNYTDFGTYISSLEDKKGEKGENYKTILNLGHIQWATI